VPSFAERSSSLARRTAPPPTRTEQTSARFEEQLFPSHQIVITARLFRNIGQRGLLGKFPESPGGGGGREPRLEGEGVTAPWEV
jgi:hypothetical protein